MKTEQREKRQARQQKAEKFEAIVETWVKTISTDEKTGSGACIILENQ